MQFSGNLNKCFYIYTLKGQCHEIFSSCFFHESSSPRPLIITLGWFRITSVRKVSKIFASQDAPTTVITSFRRLALTTGVMDTGGASCAANIFENFRENNRKPKVQNFTGSIGKMKSFTLTVSCKGFTMREWILYRVSVIGFLKD